jgi:uncharacterized RDD family membrane protein YckC
LSDPNRPRQSPDFASPANPYGEPPAGHAHYGQFSGTGSAGSQHPYPGTPYVQPSYPQPGYSAGLPGPVAFPRTDYARWGKRALAMLIDQFPAYIAAAVFCVGYVVFFLELSTTAGSGSVSTTGIVLMIIGFTASLAALGWTLYNRWLVAGRTGQSWGKRVTNIALISEQTGQPIGPFNAFVRDLVHILDGLAYVGYLWPLWDDKSQTFADMLMRTIVVLAPPRPSQ